MSFMWRLGLLSINWASVVNSLVQLHEVWLVSLAHVKLQTVTLLVVLGSLPRQIKRVNASTLADNHSWNALLMNRRITSASGKHALKYRRVAFFTSWNSECFLVGFAISVIVVFGIYTTRPQYRLGVTSTDFSIKNMTHHFNGIEFAMELWQEYALVSWELMITGSIIRHCHWCQT